MNWYIKALKNYAVFGGRARRTEYWMFVLFNMIVAVVLAAAVGLLGGPGFLNTIYSLGVLIPSLAVSVRRLHDTGRTGWWLLIGLIPLIGFIVLLIFFVKDSDPENNEYGSNPKLEAA